MDIPTVTEHDPSDIVLNATIARFNRPTWNELADTAERADAHYDHKEQR